MSLSHGGGTFIKGYKELLRKTVSGHGHDVADSYSGGVARPHSAAANATMLMLRSEFSFERAFTRVKDAALASSLTGGIKLRWRASKQAAREHIRSVLGSYVDCGIAEVTPHTAATAAPPQAVSGSVADSRVATAAATDPALQPILGQDGFMRRSIIYVLARASHGFMTSLNSTDVQGSEVMERALQRPAGQPLITVSNHIAALDDPLVMATIIPPSYYSQPQSVRWTMCATDRCFKYRLLSPLFTAGKVLPVERGAGLGQAGVRAAEERLAAGDWVHIFPEGTRGMGGNGKPLGQVRRGVGRLVASCPTPPLVVPFVHSGMEAIMPRGKVLPSVGKQVKVLVGEPIVLGDLLEAAATQRWSEDRLHVAIAERVGRKLNALKARLDGVACADDTASADTGAASSQSADIVSSSGTFYPVELSTAPASLWERLQFKTSHRMWQLRGASGSMFSSGSNVLQAAAHAESVQSDASSSSSSTSAVHDMAQGVVAAASGSRSGVSRVFKQIGLLDSAVARAGSVTAGAAATSSSRRNGSTLQQVGAGHRGTNSTADFAATAVVALPYQDYLRRRSDMSILLVAGAPVGFLGAA